MLSVSRSFQDTANSDNKPWAYTCSKVLSWWAYFQASLFSEGLLIGGNFVSKWVGLDNKNGSKHEYNSLKTNS